MLSDFCTKKSKKDISASMNLPDNEDEMDTKYTSLVYYMDKKCTSLVYYRV